MFRQTHPTGVLETRPRNSETLESLMIDMYRAQSETLRRRVDELEQQLARVLAKSVLKPSRCDRIRRVV